MSYCTLQATPVRYDGETPFPGARLNVYRAVGNGVIIGNLQTVYTFLGSGGVLQLQGGGLLLLQSGGALALAGADWYPLLRFERLSSVYMQLDDGPISLVEIPNAETALLKMIDGVLTATALGAPGNLLLQGGGQLLLQTGGALQLQA